MSKCVCNSQQTCLEALNRGKSDDILEHAFQSMRKEMNWYNPKFPTKEIFFSNVNDCMRQHILSSGGSSLFIRYKEQMEKNA